MDTNRFVELHPRVYHMAESGSWKSIRQHGLLSTSAVLDHARVSGAERTQIEYGHRPTKLLISGQYGDIVLRDQIPMPPKRLARALGPATTCEKWYAIINSKVFFWAQEERLHRLLNARAYRALEHDVLIVNTESLIAAHGQRMWLCHMNSGNTFPMPFPRDETIFKRIDDYPVNRRNNPTKNIVEVLVDYSVPDIASHVVEVWRMRGSARISRIA